MGKKSVITRNGGAISIGLLLLAALYLTSQHSYLLFHSVIELFTIIVAAEIFVIAWNARSYINNNYLLFIAIASVFVALLDFFHTLAYEGMGVFSSQTANLATQLWVAARYLQSISWLIAPFFLRRKLKLHLELVAYALVTGLLILSIFYWQNFPTAYVEGVGLTSFKEGQRICDFIIFSRLDWITALATPGIRSKCFTPFSSFPDPYHRLRDRLHVLYQRLWGSQSDRSLPPVGCFLFFV